MSFSSMRNEVDIDYTQLKPYQKLSEYLNERRNEYSENEIETILNKFARTFYYRTSFSPQDYTIEKILNYKPEILSFYDMLKSTVPLLKFIWMFYKNDEKEVDNIFKKLELQTENAEIETDNSDIIIRIVKIPYEPYDFSGGKIGKGINKSLQVSREKGYTPFKLLKSRMINHGMSWLDFSCTEEFDLMDCMLLKVFDLPQDKGWSKEGWREDLQCAFRSSWEANIARLLNYKNIKWTYESETLSLDLSKEKVNITSTYIPDFILEDNSIIEIKGFWDMRSKAKMKFVKEQYPKRKILVVDCDIYLSIYRKYHDIIPNWEEDNVSPFHDVIQIVGIGIPERKPFVDALSIDEELILIRDINNEFDINAIKVTNQKGNHVGFVAKDYASILAPKMDMGFKYKVTVKGKEPKVIQCNAKLLNVEEIILPDIFK